VDDLPGDDDDDEPFEVALKEKEDSESDDTYAQVEIPFRTPAEIKEKGKKSVDFLFLIGPSGVALPATEWDELTKHGCSQCTGNLLPADHKEIKWINTQTPLCPDCVKAWEKFSRGEGPLPGTEAVH